MGGVLNHNYDKFSPGKPKKLPVSGFEHEQFLVCLELLSVIYAESSILPVSLEERDPDSEDYLSQKYLDVMEPMMLEIKGEFIFPVMGLFDSKMFVLNYQKFYR